MLQFSFSTLIDNFGFWIGLILTVFGILAAAAIIFGITGTLFLILLTFPLNILLATPTFLMVIYVISMIIAGATQIGLDFYDKRESTISQLWNVDSSKPLNLLIAALLYVIMVSVGLLFFVIPGIYLAVKFWFFTQIIVDKNLGPIAALKESGRITQSRLLEVFILLILTGLVGLIPFVGQILSLLCSCYLYRQLEPQMAQSFNQKEIA